MKKLIHTALFVIVFVSTAFFLKRIKKEASEIYMNYVDFMASKTTVSPLGI